MKNVRTANIHFIKGNATRPRGDGTKIICHICNDIGAWGAGFVLAISKRWSEPEDTYKEGDLTLGSVSIVEVEKDIIVANMIAQHGIHPDKDGVPPIRYGALRQCLTAVNTLAKKIDATIHMPKIGTGLAGGNWDIIYKIIQKTAKVNTYIYDLN